MLEGEIREINLLERMVELWREKFTGALRFENDGIIKILYFKGGDVLSASTNDRADSVDEILMRAGKVTRDHVKQALTKRKESETLGDALLNLGFITRKELTWGRRMQAISVIRSIGTWETGSFTIVENYLPKREEGTIFPLPQLLTEIVVTDQDRGKFEKLLDSGSAVFAKMPGFDDSFRQLGLNEDAETLVKSVDGVRSAAEVVAISGQEAFNSYKLLHALTMLGLLHRLPAGRAAVAAAAPAAVPDLDDFGFETAGVSDAADAWSLPAIEPALMAPTPEATTEISLEPVEETTPSWEPPAPPPAPPPPVLRVEPEETPEFGFDEAQVEAARRATASGSIPLPDPRRAADPMAAASARSLNTSQSFKRAPLSSAAKPKKAAGRFGLVVALIAVFILAGVAYGGFLWWSAREETPAIAIERRPRPTLKPAATTPTDTGTIVEMPAPTGTTVTTGTTAGGPLTTTVATVSAPPVPLTITPAPVQPPKPVATATSAPAPSAATGDYDAQAREFALRAKGQYTVQFGIMCDPSNVAKALNIGGSNVGLAPITLKGRPCYRLFWGDYATRQAAEAGVNDLPKALRESKPAVVTIPR